MTAGFSIIFHLSVNLQEITDLCLLCIILSESQLIIRIEQVKPKLTRKIWEHLQWPSE